MKSPKGFKPPIGMRNRHFQTLVATWWPKTQQLSPQSLYHLSLDDGDTLVLAENEPEAWQGHQRIAILVHGLSGCHQSGYMGRMALRLVREGHRVIRVNLRGCGPGVGLATQPYHSGSSDDIRQVIEDVHRRWPDASLTLMGFSLGANLSLKLAGENPAVGRARLDSVIAVSPPVDLEAAAIRISQLRNRHYNYYFVRRLKRHVRHLESTAGLSTPFKFPRRLGLREFDEIYTSIKGGFTSASEYYDKTSPKKYLSHIEMPCLIVCSKDDPIVDYRSLEQVPLPSNINLMLTRYGGHVGFLNPLSRQNRFWLNDTVIRWMARLP